MLYVKVMGFQSFGDGWKVFIQIMDEQLASWMKWKIKFKNLKLKKPWMDGIFKLWMKKTNNKEKNKTF
jgi:hypothetical protein